MNKNKNLRKLLAALESGNVHLTIHSDLAPLQLSDAFLDGTTSSTHQVQKGSLFVLLNFLHYFTLPLPSPFLHAPLKDSSGKGNQSIFNVGPG